MKHAILLQFQQQKKRIFLFIYLTFKTIMKELGTLRGFLPPFEAKIKKLFFTNLFLLVY